ncbi:beta-ketoacyl-ACP reductase [Mycobacterium saskatchewanense]|uniref:3-oxoacyl-[acyl-carrier-protein] reductase MabA n=1 Tax=Mycobacterium saskatchewanense TaxID=220927 RepID=A0AAJ3NRY8_9MYCO|nr:SDR family NAD(P)-dependent oxidoreductase [Mycobacterium saskatchewanense]ORW72246.1 3-oxoacyl-ACP reductase [Mycobacterium saskatchewanense]BBX63904.1 beta-ketoacyl-ACP reductase [Mycobacterium saskatchewanense]
MSGLPTTSLAGRTAFVTGAARGMGATHAATLADRGADLLIADLDTNELEVVAKEIRADTGRQVHTLTLDVTTPDAGTRVCDRARQVFGGLDIVVHNAGIVHDWKTLADTPAAHLQPYLDVNVLGPYEITRTLFPLLKNSTAGRVIFISSQWGQVPDGHSYGYMVSKAAQLGLMKALAIEMVPHRILVNAIAPGAIQTRMVPQDVYEAELAAVPLGRLGDPAEISAAVAFLASDAAGFITGQTLAVNGGALIPAA